MNETLEALLAATSTMWPAPATVRLATRGTRSGDRHTPLREFLLLPSAQRPKLVVPACTTRAGREALRRNSQDLTLYRRLARVALSVGLPVIRRTWPDRLRITSDPGSALDSLDRHLAELLGHDVLLSFGVGSPRANRKPVLQIHRADGTTVAYAKLGTSAVTRELVRGEAEALAAYWSADAPAGQLAVPRVLHTGTWNGVELLVMTALAPSTRRSDRRTAVPHAAMRELATRWGTTRARLAETPFWQAIRDVPELESIAAEVESRHGGTEVTLGAWHGDWTPWNMAWDRDRVLLWDFERFATGVPLGLDEAHHRFQTALRKHGETYAAGLVEGTDDLTTAVYLCELARRWVLASAPPDGAPLRPRTAWLLGLLRGYPTRRAAEVEP